jgi:hypothetical protein
MNHHTEKQGQAEQELPQDAYAAGQFLPSMPRSTNA